ncbi:MAG: T9SS type A sorting domain-containing protein [Bacteroidetes bacterium]|nr:T9SS type A sorting domain-containing protein [Bacteroidota bacterium]
MKKIILLIFLFSTFRLFSQHVYLAGFNINTDNKKVFIDWTLAGGSTCNGMKIFRSLDTINFVEIGDIAGICGSSSAPVGYNFVDTTPLFNQTIYYRLRFGYSQLSEIKTILIKNNGEKDVLVKPNPSMNKVIIEFDNSKNDMFKFRMYNSIGALIYFIDNIKDSSIALDVTPFQNGQYIFTLDNGNDKNITENLIIAK